MFINDRASELRQGYRLGVPRVPAYLAVVPHYINLHVAAVTDIGGATVDEATKRMMTFLLDHALSRQYNFLGRNGKREFKALKLYEVIYGGLKKNAMTSQITRKDAEKAVSKWLIGARDRGEAGTHNQPIWGPVKVGPIWEKPGLPMWVLARAHVKPTFSPSGLAHMGPPWNPWTKLTGPHLGSPDGAHSPAHIHALWAPHGCVDREVTN
ncbi:hypothetical protein QQF64_013570 [Cirrhinus molitorella]|uniref:Uncharacterized protein n=1 Tax=Cirrhinus molitorella TaxID=172907 RepID=A0ABR3LV20_9TELE